MEIIVGFGYPGHKAWKRVASTEEGRDLRHLSRGIKEVGNYVHGNIPRAALSLAGAAVYSVPWMFTGAYSMATKGYNALWGTQGGAANAGNRHWYNHWNRPHMDWDESPFHAVPALWGAMAAIGLEWQAPVRPDAPVVPGSAFDKDRVYKPGEENTPQVRKEYNEWITKRMLKTPDKLYNWIRSETTDGLPMALNGANAQYRNLRRLFGPNDTSVHSAVLAAATAEFTLGGTGAAAARAADVRLEIAVNAAGVVLNSIDATRSHDGTLAADINDVITTAASRNRVLQRYAELAAARAAKTAAADLAAAAAVRTPAGAAAAASIAAAAAANQPAIEVTDAGLQAAAAAHPDLVYTAPVGAGIAGTLASNTGGAFGVGLIAAINAAIANPDATVAATDAADQIRNGHIDALLIMPSETANNILQMHLEYNIAEYSLKVELKMATKDMWLTAMYGHLGLLTSANKDEADALRVRRTAGLIEIDPIMARTQASTAPTPSSRGS